MRSKKMAPVHPGEILMEEFLKPFGISQYKLAKDITVPHDESMKSSMGIVLLLPTPLFVCRATSTFQSGSGLTSRHVTTLKCRKTN